MWKYCLICDDDDDDDDERRRSKVDGSVPSTMHVWSGLYSLFQKLNN